MTYDYPAFWRVVTRNGRAPCALKGSGACSFSKDAHHYFPKRRITTQLGRSPAATKAKMDAANGVCLCRFHHDKVEAMQLECPRPAELEDFLARHGLVELLR